MASKGQWPLHSGGDLQTEEKLETTSGNSGLLGEGFPTVQHIGILSECVVSSGIIA
jgi:hypothetical protein